MRTPQSLIHALLISLVLAVTGCGPDTATRTSEGGIGGSGGGGGDVAEGGIGGSGSGTTTGYGSIYINDYRYYQIAEDAIVRLDGELVTPTTINGSGQGLPLGMVVEFLLDETANPELTHGTVIEMETNHQVIGPVTNQNPLQILGQPVQLSGATLLDGLDPTNLPLGTLARVAGLEDALGTLRASRLASADTVSHWQLIGRISDLTSAGFRIGNQMVDLGSVSPTLECDGPLSNGQSVLLKAAPQSPFLAGDALTGVTLVRCLQEGLNLFGRQVPETLPATTDGFVTAILESSSEHPLLVKLGGQIVDLSEVVDVLIATLARLQVGSRLEVDGILNTETGVLKAHRVRLKDQLAVMEIIAPVTAIDNGLITVLGKQVVALPLLEGTIYDAVAVGETIRLLGFVTDGVLYAVAVFGTSADTVELKGPVTGIADDGNTLMLAEVPFPVDSADSITLLNAVGEVVELVNGACQAILPLLCPAEDSPPELVGTLATLTNSSFTGSSLYGGDLTLQEPTE
jgi:hypothetical protein